MSSKVYPPWFATLIVGAYLRSLHRNIPVYGCPGHGTESSYSFYIRLVLIKLVLSGKYFLKLIKCQQTEQLSKNIPGREEYVKKLNGYNNLVIMLFAVFRIKRKTLLAGKRSEYSLP
jgi:hypothetical protein